MQQTLQPIFHFEYYKVKKNCSYVKVIATYVAEIEIFQFQTSLEHTQMN